MRSVQVVARPSAQAAGPLQRVAHAVAERLVEKPVDDRIDSAVGVTEPQRERWTEACADRVRCGPLVSRFACAPRCQVCAARIDVRRVQFLKMTLCGTDRQTDRQTDGHYTDALRLPSHSANGRTRASPASRLRSTRSETTLTVLLL